MPRFIKSLSTILLMAPLIYAQNSIADSSLVAFYPFNRNTNDSSGYDNHGSNNGALFTTDRFNNDSSAYEFNGTSSYISIPSSVSLKSPVEEITLSAWVYTYNFSLIGSSFGPVLMKSNASSNAFQYRMAVTASGTNFSLNNWDTSKSSNTPLNFNTWHFIVASFKDDSVRFYQDGILVNTEYFPVNIIADDRVLEIGRDVPGVTEIFYGKIDDIRIYNRAISEEEVDSLYNLNGWGETDHSAPELVAYFPFDGDAQDQSPYNNHGIVYNATKTSDRFGNDSSAYHFDGSSSYIDIGSHPTLKMDDAVTIATWVNITLPLSGGTGWYNVISDHSASYNNGKIFRFQGNAIEFLLGPEGSKEAKYTFPDSASGWHHIATTYDGDSIRIYINGIKKAAGQRIGTISVNPNPLLIGKSGFSEFFTGDIDELRIYKGALSAEQIKAVYNELESGLLFAVNDTAYVTPGDTIDINVMANDYQLNGDNFVIDSFDNSKTAGSVALNDSVFRYFAPQITGIDSFSYTIKDDALNKATAKVYIKISAGLAVDEWTVVLYNFEDDAGDLIRDISGNKLHALNDSTTLQTGPWGNMRIFSGNASIEMDIVRQALQEAPEWSIEFLGRSLDSISTPGFVNHCNGNGWVLLPSGTGIYYGVKTTSTNNLWISGSWASLYAGPRDTSWHYYAMSYKESDSLRVYKDGKFLGGYAVSGQFKLSSPSNSKAYIGHSDFGDAFYNGLLDEVRVSNIMRTGAYIEKTAKALNLYPIINTVEDNSHLNPQNFSLQQNYPNPFNPVTTIRYSVGANHDSPVLVELSIYNLLGQKVATLVDKKQAAGSYQVEWNAADFASGIYIYTLETSSGFKQSRKLVLLK